MKKNRKMYLSVMFRVDGCKNMYRNDLVITDVGLVYVKEMLKILSKEIKEYFKRNNIE